MKTNHNFLSFLPRFLCAVSYITKLLNWKQITTGRFGDKLDKSCFLYNKVTKLKTNHNSCPTLRKMTAAVSYITKLLNWKQITTSWRSLWDRFGCFLYNKVTKLKTNHNRKERPKKREWAVSYITKLLNWKQITTDVPVVLDEYKLFPI